MALARIIIPAKNEEKYLPLLLKSIKKQSFKDYEIFVADASSSDNTVKIAKKYGCKIAKGGLPSIARNNAAKGSKSKILVFFDSDAIIKNKDFLKTAINIFQKEKLIAAGFYIKYPKHNNLLKSFYLILVSFLQNFVLRMLQRRKKPTMQGAAMIFDSKSFFRVNGFNDVFAEESDILERILKVYNGKDKPFRIIKEAGKVIVSERRFEKEGYPNYSLKAIKLLFHAFIIGKHKSSEEYFKE